jgi:hypothetical protein
MLVFLFLIVAAAWPEIQKDIARIEARGLRPIAENQRCIGKYGTVSKCGKIGTRANI